MKLRPAVLLAAILLTGCPPSIDVGTGPITVGPEGGIFVREGFGMEFPRGAVTETVTITVTTVDTGVPEVPGRTRVSLGFRFSPTSLTFASPVKVFLPWLDERVPDAVELTTLDMRRQAGADAFFQLDGAKTSTEPFRAVEALTERLGLFWITSPSQGNFDTLELDPSDVVLRPGQTQAFTATVKSPTGEDVDVAISWAAVPSRVGTITQDGVFTATDVGTATITARAGNLTATTQVFIPSERVVPTTFTHENPFPTGNDLLGGALAPGGLGAVFVGNNGTVLARTGEAWTRLFSSPGLQLMAVGGTDQTNAVAVGRAGLSGVLVEFRGSLEPAVRVFPPVQISELGALWFDGTHGMAVGSGNDVLIRRGGAWEPEYHPSFEKLLSVIGDGAGGFVVVGDLGSLYRWDPARRVWDSLFQTRLAVKLDAATVVDAVTGEAWAVGGNRLWHFLPGGWTAENLPPEPRVRTATAVARFAGRLFIAAQLELDEPLPPARGAIIDRSIPPGGGPPEYRWQPVRELQIPRSLFGGGPASTVGYAVGDLGAVWEWDPAAEQFVERSRGFYGDVAGLAVTTQGVFAAVNECTSVSCEFRRGVVMRQAAGQWEALPPFPQPFTVRDISGRSLEDLVVATSGGPLRLDGGDWVFVPGGSGAVLDMTTCPDRQYAVGFASTFLAGTATLAPAGTVPPDFTFTSAHCATPGEVWVAGGGFLGRQTGGGGLSSITSEDIRQGPWRAVFSPGPGEAFAFGDARFGVYFDTAQLSVADRFDGFLPDVVNGLWGDAIDTLYMVGLTQLPLTFGFAARFDGVSWRLVDQGAHRTGTAIDGTGVDTLYVGTEGGGVLKVVPVPP